MRIILFVVALVCLSQPAFAGFMTEQRESLALSTAKSQVKIIKEVNGRTLVTRYNGEYEGASHVSIVDVWAPGTDISRYEIYNYLIEGGKIVRSEETMFPGNHVFDKWQIKQIENMAKQAYSEGEFIYLVKDYRVEFKTPERRSRSCRVEVAVFDDFLLQDIGLLNGCEKGVKRGKH